MRRASLGLLLLLAGAAARAQDSLRLAPGPIPAALLSPVLPGVSARGQLDIAARRLRSPDPRERLEAIARLGEPGLVEAVPLLGAALLRIDELPELREAAALALGRVANWRASGFLNEALRDPSPELRIAASAGLARTGAPQAWPALARTLARDGDWRVRLAAASAMGESEAPPAVRALALSSVSDPETEVRLQAVRSLGRIGSREAALALAGAISSPLPALRAAAAGALGRIRGLESAGLLVRALREEEDEATRAAMLSALRELVSI